MKNLPFGIDETMNLRQAARIAFHHGKRLVLSAVPIGEDGNAEPIIEEVKKEKNQVGWIDPRCA